MTASASAGRRPVERAQSSTSISGHTPTPDGSGNKPSFFHWDTAAGVTPSSRAISAWFKGSPPPW